MNTSEVVVARDIAKSYSFTGICQGLHIAGRLNGSDPDTLDITREPNKHLNFGLGNHFCLGASLARMEGQNAISTLLGRALDLRLTVVPDALRWRPGLVLRGLESLPVAL